MCVWVCRFENSIADKKKNSLYDTLAHLKKNNIKKYWMWWLVYQFCSTCSNRVRSQPWIIFQQLAANPIGCYTSSLPIFNSSIFFLAIFEYKISIGCVVSYKLGACKIIIAEPNIQANANIHRNKRSSTIATYFQSSSTWNDIEKKHNVLNIPTYKNIELIKQL